jgi:predicted secreted acid phosphatase
MEGGQYDDDMNSLTQQWWAHFSEMTPGPKDLVVFDIDDTVLSSYLEMKSIGFGYILKETEEFQENATAPVIPETQMLYNNLQKKGFQIVFLTGRRDTLRNATAANLELRGLVGYVDLILREPLEYNLTAQDYKSARRAELASGPHNWNIVGTIGDQWSDISGENVGYRMKVINYCYFLP